MSGECLIFVCCISADLLRGDGGILQEDGGVVGELEGGVLEHLPLDEVLLGVGLFHNNLNNRLKYDVYV